MNHQIARQPFPYAALPRKLMAVAQEIHNFFQAPMEMIISSLLIAMSIACQGLLRVRLLQNSIVPVSLFLILIASSGEGKTTLDKLVLWAIREFVKAFNAGMMENLKMREFELEIWSAKQNALFSKLKSATINGQSTHAEEAALAAHRLTKPVPPKLLKLESSDATREAIEYNLHTHIASGALISSEGSIVLNGHAGRALELLNKLFDSEDISVDRKQTGSFTVESPSFSLSVMIQPDIFLRFMEHQGKFARDVGFAGRTWVVEAESTLGMRYLDDIPDASLHKLAEFHAWMTGTLHATYDQPDADKIILNLSHEAKLSAKDFQNYISGHMANGGYFADVKDAAAKTPERVARLAALFHYYEGRTGDIQKDTYQQASDVCEWYLGEYRRIFAKPPEVPVEQIYASQLKNWFVNRIKTHGNYGAWPKNHVRRCAPNKLRNDRFNIALEELVRAGCLSVTFDGKITWIYPNPQHFAPLIMAQQYPSDRFPSLPPALASNRFSSPIR